MSKLLAECLLLKLKRGLMNNKGRRDIVKKGNQIKELLDTGVRSILIIGEADCGKSLLFGHLENSLKNEPAVFELGEIKGNRKHKLKDISILPHNIILIDDADKLHTESIVNNLVSLDNKKKTIIMFSREADNTREIVANVDKTLVFSEII